MSNVLLDPSWVTVTLDTHPPVVAIEAEDSIDPPVAWDVLMVANEDIGGAAITVEDAYGTVTDLGHQIIDARTLRVLVPSEGLSGGPATLRGSVWDLVCNEVAIESRVFVRRLAPFEADLVISGAFDVAQNLDHAFAVEWVIGSAFEVTLTLDRAFTVAMEVTPAFDAKLTLGVDHA